MSRQVERGHKNVGMNVGIAGGLHSYMVTWLHRYKRDEVCGRPIASVLDERL
jgi:hypothetical protein